MPIRSDPETWTDPRQRRGLAGEEEAIRYLVSRGWVILAHRFRMRRLEVDLIAQRGRVIAFIEVKTRRGADFGSPFEAVTWAKRREIVRVARAWIDRFGRPADVYRFDVIAVREDRLPGRRVEHLEDAFRPGWR